MAFVDVGSRYHDGSKFIAQDEIRMEPNPNLQARNNPLHVCLELTKTKKSIRSSDDFVRYSFPATFHAGHRFKCISDFVKQSSFLCSLSRAIYRRFGDNNMNPPPSQARYIRRCVQPFTRLNLKPGSPHRHTSDILDMKTESVNI